ncbi:MAG: fibrillarin-like rRNA/tRNA 2'-O-methyltransferase [Sulfolobales archaeon]|nr:fibrillarin-like rRNA/tRNA 2'-O-methyltransferase [Sulfolobales archaeon]MDW8010529.1 fibrillarin-like rRNA/tRNA 2'-O-methyltransferase [Sulfolobales archaeon]
MIEVVSVKEHPSYRGVYVVELEDGSVRLATKNLTPGRRVYGEWLFNYGNVEYREWNHIRSKLAASLYKGIKELAISIGSRVLYLGAGSGTTASHVSDIVEHRGRIYAVEFAPRVMRELVSVADYRKNIVPILADARFPEKYSSIVPQVDVLYADIAQPEQAGIVAANARMFLKIGGYLYLAIKARSIDVTREPDEIYVKEIKTLEKSNFEILDVVHLDPYDKDHAMVFALYK